MVVLDRFGEGAGVKNKKKRSTGMPCGKSRVFEGVYLSKIHRKKGRINETKTILKTVS